MKVYTVSDVGQFQALWLPLPANGKVFWSQGTAGGVLLFPGVHYQVQGATFRINFPAVTLGVGDMIAVVV